jgi:hypothetical protein
MDVMLLNEAQTHRCAFSPLHGTRQVHAKMCKKFTEAGGTLGDCVGPSLAVEWAGLLLHVLELRCSRLGLGTGCVD